MKFFSLVLLISFLNTNLSLCGLITDSCKSEKTSCCCKEYENNTSTPVNLEKKCCCEIKTTTSQPAEINLSLTETNLKNISLTSDLISDIIYDNSDFDSGNNIVLSFHTPTKKKIHILNSNFRI